MRSLIATAVFLALYGNLSAGQDPPRPRPSAALLDKNRLPTEYNIGPGDVLRILTWKEPDFSGSFLVRFDGKITIPFVGDIAVAGRTPDALKGELEAKIGGFVELARVSVAIEQPNSARFFVLGKVATQGAFPYTGPVRVAQALALAGGFEEFAKLDQIFVIREVEGELIYFPFNYDDMVNRRQLGSNLVLQPGDTIVVP
jgi:polysaccharide export outer membrane protein